MAHGRQAVAGGPQKAGIRKSGTCWPRPAAARLWHAFWSAIMSNAKMAAACGSSRPSMTDDEAYIELHAASAFSFLDGGSQPESLAERAEQRGMPSLALADRNGLYGIARFHTMAKKCGVKAHIGAEIAVRSIGNKLTPPAWLPHQYPKEPPRLLLLCASQTGYQNLCQLITRFKMREATKTEGAATLEDIEEFSDGLICLTGGDEGPIAAALAQGEHKDASSLIDRLSAIFGHGNLYLELQRHQQRDEEIGRASCRER